MTPLAEVVTVRARMRRAAVLETAAQWSLYAALAAAVLLFAGGPKPLLGVALAIPLVAAAVEAARRIELRTAAAALDRDLGLDERVATALETPSGPFADISVREARRVLSGADFRRVGAVRWSPEAKLLPAALALVALLGFGGRSEAPLSMAGSVARLDFEIRALEKASAASPKRGQIEEILRALRSENPAKIREAAEAARKLAAALRAEAATNQDPAARELADLLEAAGAGAARELAAAGITVPDVAPADVDVRAAIARARDPGAWSSSPDVFDPAKIAASVPMDGAEVEVLRRSLSEKRWDPRHDELVRRYYVRIQGGKP